MSTAIIVAVLIVIAVIAKTTIIFMESLQKVPFWVKYT